MLKIYTADCGVHDLDMDANDFELALEDLARAQRAFIGAPGKMLNLDHIVSVHWEDD